jgi:hypothetical protein
MTDTQRQVLLNVYLSPESIRACTVRFDGTDLKEGALKNKSVSDDSVCQVLTVVVSVCGIQLPVFSYRSQVCIGSVDCYFTLKSVRSISNLILTHWGPVMQICVFCVINVKDV